MDAKLINPFVDAFTTVLPQIGFQSINRSTVAVKEKSVSSLGVTVLVGVTKQVRGNIAYNMDGDTARFIASTMMCGMPITELDDMAQSAISELANMITANAATNLAAMEIDVDISTPSLTVGDGFAIKISNAQYLSIQMSLEDKPLEINIALE